MTESIYAIFHIFIINYFNNITYVYSCIFLVLYCQSLIVPVPTHFFGELARTTHGVSILSTGNIPTSLSPQVLLSPSPKAPPSPLTEMRTPSSYDHEGKERGKGNPCDVVSGVDINPIKSPLNELIRNAMSSHLPILERRGKY